METIESGYVTALVALCAGALMVRAGIAKRQLQWRPRRTRRGRGWWR